MASSGGWFRSSFPQNVCENATGPTELRPSGSGSAAVTHLRFLTGAALKCLLTHVFTVARRNGATMGSRSDPRHLRPGVCDRLDGASTSLVSCVM